MLQTNVESLSQNFEVVYRTLLEHSDTPGTKINNLRKNLKILCHSISFICSNTGASCATCLDAHMYQLDSVYCIFIFIQLMYLL